jgi:hypothetical protein
MSSNTEAAGAALTVPMLMTVPIPGLTSHKLAIQKIEQTNVRRYNEIAAVFSHPHSAKTFSLFLHLSCKTICLSPRYLFSFSLCSR